MGATGCKCLMMCALYATMEVKWELHNLQCVSHSSPTSCKYTALSVLHLPRKIDNLTCCLAPACDMKVEQHHGHCLWLTKLASVMT